MERVSHGEVSDGELLAPVRECTRLAGLVMCQQPV
jgi:hypothetical protein